MGRRQDRQDISNILDSGSFQQFDDFPLKKVISNLFRFICQADSRRWAAITAFGIVTARLFEEDQEAARIVVRRLIWNLNDESGGIGWGAPETMAEIMRQSPEMADEFAPILVSYIREDGSFLEYELLQRGVIWGLGRLAESQSDLLRSLNTHRYLRSFLESPDATVRGLTARALARLGDCEAIDSLKRLQNDDAPVIVFEQGMLVTLTTGALARDAVTQLSG